MARLKEPKTQIDRIREVSPRYADLLAKNSELVARHEAVLAEIRPLAEEERRHNTSWISQAPKAQPKPIKRHEGAVAILGDLLPEQPAVELTPPPPRPSWPGEDRLRELGAESESIAEAIRLLSPELRRARKEYSLKVAALSGAEYAGLAESVVDAARKLGDAIQQHHRWIDEQRLNGVAYQAFRPLNLERFGNLGEPGTILAQTIMDAVERGHFGAGKIPQWENISPPQGGELA